MTELLPGRISITRPFGHGCDYISITITDETSGISFVEARVKYADFALALGASERDCGIQVFGLDLVGMQREHKTESIFIPSGPYKKREVTARQAIKPYEVEGWKGSVRDALNHHNTTECHKDGATRRVTFVRWVEREKLNVVEEDN